MGKNSVIKSLGKCIGNVVLHKFLVEHTNKPESKNYLKNEVIEYTTDAFEKAQEFNWNKKDKEKIKELSLKRINNLIKNYSDVVYNKNKIEKLINETMDNMMLF